jgi:hypothetical protein
MNWQLVRKRTQKYFTIMNAHQTPLIERVERALVLAAVLIELDGDIHVPLYERLEAELEALRRKEGTIARARRLLDSYNRSGELNAISSMNLSFNDSAGPLPYLGL